MERRCPFHLNKVRKLWGDWKGEKKIWCQTPDTTSSTCWVWKMGHSVPGAPATSGGGGDSNTALDLTHPATVKNKVTPTKPVLDKCLHFTEEKMSPESIEGASDHMPSHWGTGETWERHWSSPRPWNVTLHTECALLLLFPGKNQLYCILK